MAKNVYLDTKITFYNARELSYTLNWLWTMLLPLFLVLVYIEEF